VADDQIKRLIKRSKTKKKVLKKKKKKDPLKKYKLKQVGKPQGEMLMPLDPELTTELQLPTGYLSVSQIEMYMRCPRQYEKRYVEGKKDPPNIAMIEGSSHHKGMQVNNTNKKEKGQDLRPKQVFEAFADYFSDNKKDVAKKDWGGEKEKDIVDRGKGLIADYMKRYAPRLMPEIIEHEIKISVAGIPILGYIDVAGGFLPLVGKRGAEKAVVDYKAAGKKKSSADLLNSVQLTMYGVAAVEEFGFHDPVLGFMTLLKPKQETAWQSTPYDLGRSQWLKHIVVSIADAISRGSFPVTNPTNWCCDPRWCGYYHGCKGKYS
jgi:CRISPR/Cas system-associated exonuclease Cas4 (RecB family)